MRGHLPISSLSVNFINVFKSVTSPSQNKKGFTLVELLVVIGIIALLSSVIFMNYQQIVKKGRDAKRQSDLRALQSAFEQYRADSFSYPPRTDIVGKWGQPLSLTTPSGTKTFIQVIPNDPLSTRTYDYTVGTNTYCLYAMLEALPTGTRTMANGCNDAAHSSYNFSLSKP